uniref:Cysteine--tRNA ligase, chloroplastic/mitochondrial isoform X3 n=1 Tax=Tanacetum cinerariifolium TaxID=118510 RepID=A0A6L2LNB6_TANCI|nr:cysteine--tRNA ligase, chloroplastic/mitochondrial isoform X3 [Tanacetum cinerariifolium]
MICPALWKRDHRNQSSEKYGAAPAVDATSNLSRVSKMEAERSTLQDCEEVVCQQNEPSLNANISTKIADLIENFNDVFINSMSEDLHSADVLSAIFNPLRTANDLLHTRKSSPNSSSQVDPKFQKDYKAEYKKMKAKLALFEAKVFDDEEVTQVKVLMALADDELTVGKSHAHNGEWVDITIRKFIEEQQLNLLSKYNKMVFELNKCRNELLILKQAKLDDVTFQIQNTELTKLNHALQEQLKEEKMINEKWLTSSKRVSQCISEQIPYQKKKVLNDEFFTESSSKMNENENLFVLASMGYDQEMVPKTKDWVERLNPDSKLLNFNTGRILVPESQVVNESLESTKTLNTHESSKDYKVESLTPLHPLKNLQGASPSLEVMPLTFQPHSPKERPGLGIVKHTKLEIRDSLDNSVLGTVTVGETEPTTTSVPTEILKAKAKPFPPCTHYGFNDHRLGDCRNYLECRIFGSYDHFTSGHNRVIHIRGGMLAESSQSRHNRVIHIREGMLAESSQSSKSSIDHLGKFDARADDGYFLRYSFISKAFRVFNTRRQQIEETYHVTFDKSMEAIRFTHTSEDEIGIDDSSRYPLDEFINKNDPSRQYQIDSDISYYVIPHGHSLSKLTQENQVPEVIAPNKPDIPHTKDTEGLPDLTNAEGTYEKNVQNDQMITQPTDVPSGNNTEVSGSITESLVHAVT